MVGGADTPLAKEVAAYADKDAHHDCCDREVTLMTSERRIRQRPSHLGPAAERLRSTLLIEILPSPSVRISTSSVKVGKHGVRAL